MDFPRLPNDDEVPGEATHVCAKPCLSCPSCFIFSIQFCFIICELLDDADSYASLTDQGDTRGSWRRINTGFGSSSTSIHRRWVTTSFDKRSIINSSNYSLIQDLKRRSDIKAHLLLVNSLVVIMPVKTMLWDNNETLTETSGDITSLKNTTACDTFRCNIIVMEIKEYENRPFIMTLCFTSFPFTVESSTSSSLVSSTELINFVKDIVIFGNSVTLEEEQIFHVRSVNFLDQEVRDQWSLQSAWRLTPP